MSNKDIDITLQSPPPAGGDLGGIIYKEDDKLIVPDNPVIPFIEGDGIGKEIWTSVKKITDKAVEKAYNGKRKILVA